MSPRGSVSVTSELMWKAIRYLFYVKTAQQSAHDANMRSTFRFTGTHKLVVGEAPTPRPIPAKCSGTQTRPKRGCCSHKTKQGPSGCAGKSIDMCCRHLCPRSLAHLRVALCIVLCLARGSTCGHWNVCHAHGVACSGPSVTNA